MKKVILRLTGQLLNGLAIFSPRHAAKMGFELFCYPFRPRLTAKHLQFLNPAAQPGFVHRGIRIQTYRWGTGPKNILLLHGWQSNTYRWKKYIESLQGDQYTIHALDAPGHGRSGGTFLHVPLYSEVILAFAGQLGRVNTIIGHSIGGFSALYALHSNKSLSIDRLVALAAPGEATEFLDFYRKSLSLSARCMRLIEDHFTMRFREAPRDFSAPRFASNLEVAGLIIHDEEDTDTPVIHAERIHEAWRHSKFIRTKGLGHNLRSEEVVAEVTRFINAPAMAPVYSN